MSLFAQVQGDLIIAFGDLFMAWGALLVALLICASIGVVTVGVFWHQMKKS